MGINDKFSRRIAVKSSLFGVIAVAVPNLLFAKDILSAPGAITTRPATNNSKYPAIADEITNEVVGVSHFNLDRLKELVNPRPELARATWDWGFGDWETAIGAASHVGRKDIVAYLLSKGARPDIFTFAMLGSYGGVKAMIETSPGIQNITGPHGISLLQHAKNGMSEKTTSNNEAGKLIDYLESLGDVQVPKYLTLEEKDKQKFLGDYKYGDGEGEGFSIKTNMRKLLTLGKIGKNGGALYMTGSNKFTYNGVPSVIIDFFIEGDKVTSLTVTEPGLVLKARKVS
jgi:hypothetical protein